MANLFICLIEPEGTSDYWLLLVDI
uniref:Uncharacterized protein n=1 Tax=Tetranychus urticae TaxID=32264 RepID=T1KGN4_TETUR